MLLHEQVLKPGIAMALDSESLQIQATLKKDSQGGDLLNYSSMSFVFLTNLQEV